MKAAFWSSLPPRKRKVALWISGLLLFYTVLGFFILPPIIRAVAVKQLSRQLNREVSIQSVKINPFALSAAVRGLLIKDKDGQPFVSWDEVYVNVQLASFFGRPWVLSDVSASRPVVRVRMNRDYTFNFSDILAKFSTNAPAKSATPAKPLAVRIERLRIAGAELDSSTAFGEEFLLQHDGDDPTNSTGLSAPAVSATNAPDGVVLLLRSVTNAVAMLLNSTNQLSGEIQDVNFTNCALHLEDRVNSRPARLDLDDITLSAKNISNLPGTNLTAALSLRWNTNGAINIAVTASLSPLAADIQLSLTNLDLGTLDPYLESKLNLLVLGSRLGLNGRILLNTPTEQLPEITFQGDARLDDFHTVDGIMAEDLLKWDSFRISGIDASLNPQTVGIREIAVDNAYARVVIETNGSINLLTALQPAGAGAPPKTNVTAAVQKSAAPATATVSSSLPKISIANIVISNAAVHFTDRSVEPAVNLMIQQADGVIAGISSEELQHADVKLHALVDGIGPADITGRINPFSGTQTNILRIAVKDVDLTPTSPYSGKFAGYGIMRGKLNLDLEYDVVGRKLKSKNVITLDQFTFGEKTDSPDATHLPVRLAIAILKDRDGRIVLDVPIEGSLDDPQFRIGKVVTRAIVNILTKVATSPFSLLGAILGGGGEELSYEDFAPGSSELLPASRQKLDLLVKGLYERPGLQLEISGSIAPAADRDGLQRAALEKQIRTRQWMSLRKAERATMTPDQVTLTPDERRNWVKKLYYEALNDGKITPALIAANTNLAAFASQIQALGIKFKKGATLLIEGSQQSVAQKPSGVPAAAVSQLKPAPVAYPMEMLLLAAIPVSDGDLETLAAARAKAVRAYILESGKVEAARLFLTGTQTGGVRPDGSRVYLQLE